MVWNL